MKKILSVLTVVLMLFALISVPASAGDWIFRESQDRAVIVDNGDRIYYKGEAYIKTDLKDAYIINWAGYINESLDYVFEDDLEDQYDYFEVYDPEDNDYIIITCYHKDAEYGEDYYVKDVYVDTVNSFINGDGTQGEYCVYNPYGTELIPLSQELIDKCVTEENKMTVSGDRVLEMHDDMTSLCLSDELGAIYREIGLILRDNKEDGTSEFYAVIYSEYELNAFYADGSLAIGNENVDINLYYLGSTADSDVLSNLRERWDEMPEDELDWVINDTSPIFTLSILIILCGILPLAGIVLSVIKLFIKKTRYVKSGYIALLAAGVVLIICFVIALVMIL